jgi:hypothetical protein
MLNQLNKTPIHADIHIGKMDNFPTLTNKLISTKLYLIMSLIKLAKFLAKNQKKNLKKIPFRATIYSRTALAQ